MNTFCNPASESFHHTLKMQYISCLAASILVAAVATLKRIA
jgi:hypothetical protein